MQIDRHEKVRCGICLKESELGEWDDLSFSKCINRQLKKLYLHLTEKKAFLKKTNSYYMCPKCKQWLKGSQLKIVDSYEHTFYQHFQLQFLHQKSHTLF